MKVACDATVNGVPIGATAVQTDFMGDMLRVNANKKWQLVNILILLNLLFLVVFAFTQWAQCSPIYQNRQNNDKLIFDHWPATRVGYIINYAYFQGKPNNEI